MIEAPAPIASDEIIGSGVTQIDTIARADEVPADGSVIGSAVAQVDIFTPGTEVKADDVSGTELVSVDNTFIAPAFDTGATEIPVPTINDVVSEMRSEHQESSLLVEIDEDITALAGNAPIAEAAEPEAPAQTVTEEAVTAEENLAAPGVQDEVKEASDENIPAAEIVTESAPVAEAIEKEAEVIEEQKPVEPAGENTEQVSVEQAPPAPIEEAAPAQPIQAVAVTQALFNMTDNAPAAAIDEAKKAPVKPVKSAAPSADKKAKSTSEVSEIKAQDEEPDVKGVLRPRAVWYKPVFKWVRLFGL